MSDFYSLKAELPDGSIYDFKQLEGKVVLIVNMASQCGLSVQLNTIQKFYAKYEGFVVLGFPTNQFWQEPLYDDTITETCQMNYGVTFPVMKKADVNGDNTNDVYKYIKAQRPGLLGLTRVKWNYEKFLVDQHGKVVQRYFSTTSPESFEKDIQALLEAK